MELLTSWGTEDLDGCGEHLKIGETRVSESTGLTIAGCIETFVPPKGHNAPAVDPEGTSVSFDVKNGNLNRGRDGLYDYGCVRLIEMGQRITETAAFLHVSDEQFTQLMTHLPIYLQSVANHGFGWTLNISTLSDIRCPEVDAPHDAKIWRFWCKHVQFWFTAGVAKL